MELNLFHLDEIEMVGSLEDGMRGDVNWHLQSRL